MKEIATTTDGGKKKKQKTSSTKFSRQCGSRIEKPQQKLAYTEHTKKEKTFI